MSSKGTLHPDEKLRLGDIAARLTRPGLALGVLCLGGSLAWGLAIGDGLRRFLHSYLLGFAYVLTFALGALFFVVLQHLVRAKWSVVVRRLAEGMTRTFPMLFVLSLGITIPTMAGYEDLFRWNASEEHVAERMAPLVLAVEEAKKSGVEVELSEADQLIYEQQEASMNTFEHAMHAKHAYLNAPFFFIRMLLYFGLWIFISRYFWRKSVAQDESGDPDLTEKMRIASAPAIIFFGLSTAFCSYDILMSLEPAWFSTMFGVYYFAGCAISIMAILSLFAYFLRRNGRLAHSVSVEHYHDLGKLMFAFVFFWAYVAFSQFMLIWYANIPEETFFFADRWHTDWKLVSILLITVHFLVPFPLLMSRHSKRKLPVLMFFAVWCLIAHWIDIYWLVMPNYDWLDHSLAFHPMDVLVTIGMIGLFVAKTGGALANVDLLPSKDPKLGASLSFENI